MKTLELKFFLLRDRICAWEFSMNSGKFEAGMGRPFKRIASLDTLYPSEFFMLPYTKKQIKAADYIVSYAPRFVELFSKCDRIIPHAHYENALKQTFGENSLVYELYMKKAEEPLPAEHPAELFIDFEAIDMMICGWYAVLVRGEEKTEFSGVAKPFSDEKRLRRKYNSVYSELLPYDIEEIVEAPHIRSFQNYFVNMFRDAKRIYTYGDTDALFIKHSFGEHIYNFFRVKNVDVAVRLGNRTISLDKTCRLFGIEVDGHTHDPKVDVEKMMYYIEATKTL